MHPLTLGGLKEFVAKKRTKTEVKQGKFYETFSLCGNERQAARLVGISMQTAYRHLADPDGFDAIQRHNQKNTGTYYTMSKEERVAFLTKCILFGAMPRIAFDEETGETTLEVVYEYMSHGDRIKCADMLNKLEGDYVERKIIEDKTHDKWMDEIDREAELIEGKEHDPFEL